MNFLHTFHPEPLLLSLGPFHFYWYGFLMALAIFFGALIFYVLAKRFKINSPLVVDLLFYVLIFGLLGSRLYHILSEFNYYCHAPLKVFFIWQGGLGIYGAIIGGALAVYFWVKKNFSLKNQLSLPIVKRLPRLGGGQMLNTHPALAVVKCYFLTLLDLIVPSLALGQALGRWGNYFNQEIFGLPTSLAWGIPIDLINRPPGYEWAEFFQPLFLYESLFCFLLFIFLFFLVRKIYHPDQPTQKLPGLVLISYLFFYGLWRFFIEFLRLDNQPVFLYLRLGQWVSILLMVIAGFIYFQRKKWYNRITKT